MSKLKTKFYKVLPGLREIAKGWDYDQFKYYKLFLYANPMHYVKIDDNLNVYDLDGNVVYAHRTRNTQNPFLKISPEHMIYFKEVKDPGEQVISDIWYIVQGRDYSGSYEVERYSDKIKAIKACIRLNKESGACHEVVLEYKASYVFEE